MSSLHSNSISVWSIVFNTVEQKANMNLTHNIFCPLFPHQRSLFTSYLHAGCCTQRRLTCGSCNSRLISCALIHSCGFDDSSAVSATLVHSRLLSCALWSARAVSVILVRFRRPSCASGDFVHSRRVSCTSGDSCAVSQSSNLLKF